jgi:hypothetical protein
MIQKLIKDKFDIRLGLTAIGRLLSQLCFTCQKPLYKKLVAAINDPKCLKYTVNCSRRFGKTTVLFLIAVEFAIKNPASNIRFFAAYQNMIQEILKEVSPVILEDAPQSIMPKFSKGKFYFKNGSVIHMAGLDNKQYNTSRGRATHLNILDEARDISELDHIYKSVLSPTTITTKGTCIFASTPPDSPAHDFVSLAKQCEAEGYYSKYTIWDNTRLDNNVVQQYIKELGGVDSVQFRREYLAEFILDEEKAVVKEWNTSKYVYEEPRDEYWHLYHRYIAMDVGVKDMTACIFGYYDFNKAKLFIEDEFHLQ